MQQAQAHQATTSQAGAGQAGQNQQAQWNRLAFSPGQIWRSWVFVTAGGSMLIILCTIFCLAFFTMCSFSFLESSLYYFGILACFVIPPIVPVSIGYMQAALLDHYDPWANARRRWGRASWSSALFALPCGSLVPLSAWIGWSPSWIAIALTI